MKRGWRENDFPFPTLTPPPSTCTWATNFLCDIIEKRNDARRNIWRMHTLNPGLRHCGVPKRPQNYGRISRTTSLRLKKGVSPGIPTNHRLQRGIVNVLAPLKSFTSKEITVLRPSTTPLHRNETLSLHKLLELRLYSTLFAKENLQVRKQCGWVHWCLPNC